MKQWMFASTAALCLLGWAQGSASAQGCGLGGYPQGGCGPTGVGCCNPCIDVYKPTIYIPQLRIPVFIPCVKKYCEPGPPKCGTQPWYEVFPGAEMGYGVNPGYNIGQFGSFNGPVGLGPNASFGNPMAGRGYYNAPGYGQYAQAPAYWYSR